MISAVKLIAEPWDIGSGGYQVGNFPILWSEWNGIFRDDVRSFLRGDPGTARKVGGLAYVNTAASTAITASCGEHAGARVATVLASGSEIGRAHV